MHFSDADTREIRQRIERLEKKSSSGDGCGLAVVIVLAATFYCMAIHDREQDLTLRQIGTATGVYIDSKWIASPAKEPD